MPAYLKKTFSRNVDDIYRPPRHRRHSFFTDKYYSVPSYVTISH